MSLEEAIWATWKGFVIFSPTPAHYLPDAIPTLPDPLDEDDWKLLKALAETDNSPSEAAPRIERKEDTVKYRMDNRIIPALRALMPGFRESEKGSVYERAQAIIWYKEHRVRYCRE